MGRKVSHGGTDVWQILICKQFAEDLWMYNAPSTSAAIPLLAVTGQGFDECSLMLASSCEDPPPAQKGDRYSCGDDIWIPSNTPGLESSNPGAVKAFLNTPNLGPTGLVGDNEAIWEYEVVDPLLLNPGELCFDGAATHLSPSLVTVLALAILVALLQWQ